MAVNGFISRDKARGAKQRPIQAAIQRRDKINLGPAVIGNVLEELKDRHAGLTVSDILLGRIQVYSTVDARVQ